MKKAVYADESLRDAMHDKLAESGFDEEAIAKAMAAFDGAMDDAPDVGDEEPDYEEDWYDDDDPEAPLGDGTFFADPGGRSALRAASRDNPRNLSCRQCGTPNVLTPADRARGYCCDRCADRNDGLRPQE